MSHVTVLAKRLGISVTDLQALATSVVNGLKADGMVEKFLAASESDRVMLVEAYVVAAIRKMDQFVNTYLTNREARELFIKAVFTA